MKPQRGKSFNTLGSFGSVRRGLSLRGMVPERERPLTTGIRLVLE